MKKNLILTCCFLLSVLTLHAEKWLPKQHSPAVTMRLLGCQYHQAQLIGLEELTADSPNWRVWQEVDSVQGGTRWVFEARRAMQQVGVAVAFDQYDWSSDNYVMIPSVVYNGNRQRIVNRAYATGLDLSDYDRPDLALTSNPIPQLSPEFGATSRLEVSDGTAATPVIT